MATEDKCPGCSEEMSSLDCIYQWDDPLIGFAFNLYACDNCGTLVKEMVWNNKGSSDCKAWDKIGGTP
jgi:uncharacterized Zn finger protein